MHIIAKSDSFTPVLGLTQIMELTFSVTSGSAALAAAQDPYSPRSSLSSDGTGISAELPVPSAWPE